MHPVRVVCDTNVLVSALLGSSNNQKIFDIFKKGRITLLFSKETLLELAEVLGRPKFKISSSEIRSLFRLIRRRAEMVPKGPSIALCRDPKDDVILAAAFSGKADYLVTGDKDILAVKSPVKIRIVTPSQFVGQFLKL